MQVAKVYSPPTQGFGKSTGWGRKTVGWTFIFSPWAYSEFTTYPLGLSKRAGMGLKTVFVENETITTFPSSPFSPSFEYSLDMHGVHPSDRRCCISRKVRRRTPGTRTTNAWSYVRYSTSRVICEICILLLSIFGMRYTPSCV